MRLVLDLETASTVDLRKTGAQAYAEHVDTRITVLCYAIDDGIVQTWTGGPVPGDFTDAIVRGAVVVAHNYLFEWNLYAHKLIPAGWPEIPLTQWSCTMARALVAGYPAGLEQISTAAKLAIPKEKGARDLMLRMARPRTTEPEVTWWHETSLEHFTRLCAYCVTDVQAERLLDRAVPELSQRERKIFEADHRLNQRGLHVDVTLVSKLHALAAHARAGLAKELIRVTNGQVSTPNQVAKLRAWLTGVGLDLPDLRRGTVTRSLLGHTLASGPRRALQARLDASRSSVAKLDAIRSARSQDGAVRGCFQYYGAGRTGRWAGRRLQPQNLFRGSIAADQVNDALIAILRQDAEVEDLGLLFGDSPMGVVASLMRSTIMARPGHKLVVVDLSQIEARVLAWLAGQMDSLDVFATGKDIYTETARKVGSNVRQLGKVLVLACIAEGEPVLTDQGLVSIERVTKAMRLWDGVEWVSHDGVICRGEREVIEYEGLRATPDHLVWTEGFSDPVPFGHAASTMERLVRSGTGGTPLRCVGGARSDIPSRVYGHEVVLSVHGVWEQPEGRLAQLEERQNQGLFVPISTEYEPLCRTLDAQSEPPDDGSAHALPELERSGLAALRWPRDHLRLHDGTGSHAVDHRQSWCPDDTRVGDRSDRQQQRLCPGQSSLGYPERAERQQTAQVYDILNAGPRHRFTVSDRLCHNCGFGMGPFRFQETAAGFGIELDLDVCVDLVAAWRRTNPCIVDYWWDTHRALMQVTRHGGVAHVGRVVFTRQPHKLLVRLPSGRHLVYRHPRIEPNPDNGHAEFTYMGPAGGGSGWTRLRSWPGKLVENIVQAVARDVMADALIELDAKGIPLTGTVHDELIAEVPDADADAVYREMQRVMAATPFWAQGLPMGAAGFIANRYQKG